MKITKQKLKQIIKEEIENALEESGYDRYRDDRLVRGYPRYKEKERYRELRHQQIKKSNEMRDLGKADALAGKPKDDNIQHMAYIMAYDETKKEMSSKKEELQETDVEEGKFRDMFKGKKPSPSPESEEAKQYMRRLQKTKRGKDAASVSVKQTGRDMSKNLAKVGGKSRFEEDTE
tara:strand:+ start:525 stop:1052 length:528 start_codon:yes stop_codon:yes gene_type:complete